MATHQTNTSLYKLNHSMVRVKDPKISVKFYEDHFGMRLVNRMDFEEAKFSLYFLACDSAQAESHGRHWTDREGILELTHNYGTENDPDYKIANGNTEDAKGFGHITFTVDNLGQVCNDLESAGVKFHKRLSDSPQRDIAFALDPDGYWIELFSLPSAQATTGPPNKGSWRLNSTMLRVKDPKESLNFYRSVLGMSLLHTAEFPEQKFTLYFLGYRRPDAEHLEGKGIVGREGILELTWNHGTESDPNFKGYHNGNAQPQGFGHTCISVDDLDEACQRFEDLKVNWKKRLTDGRMRNVAFVLDPDGYWVEVIQNERLKKRADW